MTAFGYFSLAGCSHLNQASKLPGDSSLGGADRIRSYLRALVQPVTYLGIAAYLLIPGRDSSGAASERRVANLARVLDQSFSHICKSIDASLLFLRKSYLQNPSGFDLDDWIHDPSIKNQLTFRFSVLDANGRVIQTSYSKSILGADRSDRAYFHVLRNSIADELFISKPLILGHSGETAIILSRRVTAPGGTFAGVIAAVLDPSSWQSRWA